MSRFLLFLLFGLLTSQSFSIFSARRSEPDQNSNEENPFALLLVNYEAPSPGSPRRAIVAFDEGDEDLARLMGAIGLEDAQESELDDASFATQEAVSYASEDADDLPKEDTELNSEQY